MARLTWQNVAAPDFGNSMMGFRAASGMLNDALRNIQGGIGAFEAQQQKVNDNAVLSRALQYTDPTAFDAAMKSGAIYGNADPSTLSLDVLNSLAGRSGTLLRDAATRQGIDQNNYDFTRRQGFDTATDNASGAISQLLATGLMGGDVGSVYRNNTELLGRLSPELQASIMNNTSTMGSRANSDRLAQASHQLAVNRDRRASAEHAQNMAANTATQEFRENLAGLMGNALDAPAARAYIDSLDVGNYAKAQLMEAANSLIPGTYGVAPTGRSGSGGSSSSTGSGSGSSDYSTQQELATGALNDTLEIMKNNPTAAIAEAVMKAGDDNSSFADVADKLGKGPLKFMNRSELDRTLNNLMVGMNIKPAQAAVLLENATRTEESWFPFVSPTTSVDQTILGDLETLVGGARNPDGTVKTEGGRRARSGLENQLAATRELTVRSKEYKDAQTRANKADTALKEARLRANGNPFIASQIPRLQAEYDKAWDEFNRLEGIIDEDDQANRNSLPSLRQRPILPPGVVFQRR